METRLFDFKWSVDSAGYDLVTKMDPELVSAGAAARLLLGEGQPEIRRRGGMLREYEPFEDAPRLHRDFAEQVVDTASALAFVQRYGFLGSMLSGPHLDSDWPNHIVSEAHAIRSVLDRIEHPKKYKDQSAAQYFNENVRPHLTVQIEASKPKYPGLQVVPRSLSGYMWLCVAEELAGGVQYRLCKNPKCRRPFKVLKDGRRQRRIFCDRPACRQAAKRERDRKNLAKRKEPTT